MSSTAILTSFMVRRPSDYIRGVFRVDNYSALRIDLGRPLKCSHVLKTSTMILDTFPFSNQKISPKYLLAKNDATNFFPVATFALKGTKPNLSPIFSKLTLNSCHPFELHASSIMKCGGKCNKLHDTCKHLCTKACGEPCGPCTTVLSTISLRCGHAVMVTCAERNSSAPPLCQAIVEELTLHCGHKFVVTCAFRDQEPLCAETCHFILECGHWCIGVCETCRKTKHAPCAQKCGKKLECQHGCDAR